jgi:hypothetical protein
LARDGSGGEAATANPALDTTSQPYASDTTDDTEAEPDFAANPDAQTPNGYRLRGNHWISPFRYDTSIDKVITEHCTNGKCTINRQVNIWTSEQLFGGSSHTWRYTFHIRFIKGDSYDFGFYYYCGVSVPRRSDWTCNTHEDAVTAPENEELIVDATSDYDVPFYADFGAGETQYRKFAGFKETIGWGTRNSYPSSGTYRMWDIKYGYNGYHGWQLPPTSGTGY